MFDGTYHFERFAREQKSVLVKFPIIVVNIPVGWQDSYCFHEHDTMELAIITEGRGHHILAGKKSPVHKGDVLLVPPGVSHAYVNDDLSLSLVNIIFDGAKLPIPPLDSQEIPLISHFFPFSKHEKAEYTAKPILHLESDAVLQDVLNQCKILVKELTFAMPGNTFSSLVRFLNIVITLLRAAPAASAQSKRKLPFGLGEVLKHIDEHFTEQIPLSTLASKAFLSVRSFQMKFKQATERTVTDYITRKRLSLAKSLLAEGGNSIQEVAAECGFYDGTYFTRIFRKYVGKTPSQFRKGHK